MLHLPIKTTIFILSKTTYIKHLFILSISVFISGLTQAQSFREDIDIQWPKTDEWELDESLSVQTNFSRRHQKWNLKHDKKESWQKMVMIMNDDITKNTMPLDSIDVSHDLSKDKGIRFTLLAESKKNPHPFRLISLENRTLKSEQTPISTLIYIIDGKTCRHMVLVSMRTSGFSADFLKQWSQILLSSKIIPSKNGNFEYTDDAYLDRKEVNGTDVFYVTASFNSTQVQYLLTGQPAKVIIDDFPELRFSGKVSEIVNVKKEFALTSPDTKTGSYIKIVEKFPVIIKVEVASGIKEKLKSGLNCRVSVATAP